MPETPPIAPAVLAKLPLAVGSFSPIFMLDFWPSTERSCGACSTLVRVSLKVAWNTAPGRVVDQSLKFTWPMAENGIAAPVVVLPVVPVPVVGVVVPVVLVEVVVLLV